MPSLDHTHTWVRYRKVKNGETQYKCDDPKCTSIIDRKLIIGKESLCTQCKQPHILTHRDLRRARPMCKNCSSTGEAKQFQAARNLTDLLISESQVLFPTTMKEEE